MTATLIDGRAVAERLRERVAARTAELARHGVIPGLAVVLVGDDPASQVYVGSKTKQAAAAGLKHFDHRLPATASTSELIALVEQLNARSDVHGILVQLPLPAGVDSAAVLAAIDPAKDVDGFHAVNAGRLALGQDATVPCTPLGCLILIREATRELAGKRAVVVGRSNIVGKPMAQLLLQNDCTVTIAHSRTRDLPQLCREAEILVAAIGRPKAIAGDWIRTGAIVIDVGINRVAGPDGKNKLVGDVDFDAALSHAGAITPVPGGVGPMTIACLLMNTVNAAIRTRAGALGPLIGLK
ncbi:bifunctional methylenetetrahydrofolate dehydrogenase/methenyltetrahydrofolate cyclohydrolase FolD [Steroidobacter agaridevorans]|uniref:bifunctional methylenetetrahydrofolate dehydrogenase/methenyltetrahydrofolate cyclohydrolase FolD n=1 Tax=Steroidobacter agaridevorans TaxID=2695856 RepID=UPI0013239E21|nr:bifunctional methylenetetrahydrofolate dehydrogenase/methenyltetrahydrofolate cyclohydrolase FolD [Steroidobacter agaridevorans]GFE90363.1 bifunctional protein FolD [Steroidobacter agaridevorans]